MRQKIRKAILLLFLPILLLSNLTTIHASDIEYEFNEDESSGHGTIAVTLNVTHIHEYDRTIVISPSCTTNGYTRYICSSCGYEKKDDIKLALGHSWDDDIDQNVSRCIRCNMTKQIQSFDPNDNVDNNKNETIKPDTNKPNDSNNTGSNKNDSNKVETDIDAETESEKEPDIPESNENDISTESTGSNDLNNTETTKDPESSSEQNSNDDSKVSTDIIIATTVATITTGTTIGGAIYIYNHTNMFKKKL